MEDTKGFVPLGAHEVERLDDLTLGDVVVKIIFGTHLVTSMRGRLILFALPCCWYFTMNSAT